MRFIFYLNTYVIFVIACEEHQTCNACIRDPEKCAWCPAEEALIGPRCISEKSIPQNWCSDLIVNPRGTIIDSSSVGEERSNSERNVQIKPQKIKVKIRPGESINFNFSYKATDDYPVDLYYIYDASMKESNLNEMLKQTEKINHWLLNLTNEVYIGFGSFTDKNALPFTAENNPKESYSFKHHLSLSKDQKAFKKALEEIKYIESLVSDKPNGGFDALAQAIACDEIGWRNKSRKFIVYSTDTNYHAAGDGKSAGIINPYDGKCYTQNSTYTKESEMDYPSTSIINQLASNKDVTIIFIVNEVMFTSYTSLMKMMHGARVISNKRTISSQKTVASELKETYENIIKVINLKDNLNTKYANKIKFAFDPNCYKSEEASKRCEIQQNSEKKIIGTVTVLEDLDADEIKVDLSVRGIKEKLTLEIQLIKDCNCTLGDNYLCHGGGERRCGICECYPNRSGVNCECSSTNTTAAAGRAACVPRGSGIECNGRGSCTCGACSCMPSAENHIRYWGRYCECDDESCPRDENGRLCGRGRCRCGACVCGSGWSRDARGLCGCDVSKDQCRTGVYECSDYGSCECNECKCRVPTVCEWDARPSQGPKCNPLPCRDCRARQCQRLEPYALSRVKLSTPCEKRINVTIVKKLQVNTTWSLCSDVRSDVGCYTNFSYMYDDEKYGVHVVVQSEHNCLESAYIYGGGCLAGVIFIGVLTLICWKTFTLYRDRLEYDHFLEEYEDTVGTSVAKNNPLFNSPKTIFWNPNFRRSSKFR